MSAKPASWWRRWSLVVPAAVLTLAAFLQAVPFLHSKPPVRPPHLAASLPNEIPGWEGHDEPLGPNEFVSDAVKNILNYDDVLYRLYARGDVTFGVYVAYWGAGKMPTRMVASHTPDRCWTENGWHCLEMRYHQPQSVAGQPLLPAEWRRFEPPDGGAPTYVWYWHLVDGRLYDYGKRFNEIPDPWLWWKDAMQQAIRGDREQYFIRLTSNRPLESLRDDPGFVAILRGLGALALNQNGSREHS